MGYNIWQTEADFKITAEQVPLALAVVVALKKRYRCDDSSLYSAMGSRGWPIQIDASDNVTGITFEGEKSSSGDDELFNAIAPYVTPGSYIDMCGEDGRHWRMRFRDGLMVEYQGTVVYNEDVP